MSDRWEIIKTYSVVSRPFRYGSRELTQKEAARGLEVGHVTGFEVPGTAQLPPCRGMAM